MPKNVVELAIQTIKTLSVDAVEQANSGHPGMPMGAADYAFLLWHNYLRYHPKKPRWENRDRFVLSGGHGCMLLYSLLHLSGFDLPLEELKNFRQWGSKTPGHPEYGLTPGVEATTGPLGQGFGNAIGMAIGQKMMAQRFNRDDFSPIDHRIYAIVTDGDLMEGITSEAASLAGHLKLSNVVFIYDENHITIDGPTEITFTEDVGRRFEAYGWHTQRIDGHNHAQITQALDAAIRQNERPALILARTHIAHGAPHKHDTAEAHGAPLGAEEVKGFKENIGWPLEPTFYIPQEVKDLFARRAEEAEKQYRTWAEGFAGWRKKHPDLASLWDQMWEKKVPETMYRELCETAVKMPSATRSISGELEQKVAVSIPGLVGGSADLDNSTKTVIKKSPFLSASDFSGRNIHFGVREHAMGAITNGLAYYGSFVPFSATFLQFSDYMRPSIRLAALSHLQATFVFTHDSVFLGEDGPTHQAIEHLGALRLIPNTAVVRPADPIECSAGWQIALSRKKGPTIFALTRQNLPAIERDSGFKSEEVLQGGYVASGRDIPQPDLLIVATGSELHVAIDAKKVLQNMGITARVISMPCRELFEAQNKDYQLQLLPPAIPTAVVEASGDTGWHRWIGRSGLIVGVHDFSQSAPTEVIAEKLGFTGPQVAERLAVWLKSLPKSA